MNARDPVNRWDRPRPSQRGHDDYPDAAADGGREGGFSRAVDDEQIRKNPFAKVKAPGGPNLDRQVYIGREDVDHVLAACPTAEWRLIVVLARFAGLRVPSELLSLRWADIEWDRNRVLIRSPKLEHLPSKGRRHCPLFPEVKAALQEVFDPEAVYVIQKYRDDAVNLRTMLARIVERAGLDPWPKPFVNLRSSCETELARKYPLFEVTKWLGNSPAIAHRHYLQLSDSSFAAAAASGAGDDASKAVQKAVQYNRPQPSSTSSAPATNTDILGYRDMYTDSQYAWRDSNPQPRGPKPRALSS